MGDFNAVPGSEPIVYCDNYADFPIKDLTTDIKTTFHAFGIEEKKCKIDYIYCDRASSEKPHEVTVWDDEKHGIFLSDHYPVCLEIEL